MGATRLYDAFMLWHWVYKALGVAIEVVGVGAVVGLWAWGQYVRVKLRVEA